MIINVHLIFHQNPSKMALKHYMPVFPGKVAALNFLFAVTSLLVLDMCTDWSLWIVALIECAYIIALAVLLHVHLLPAIFKVVLCSHGIGLVFAIGALIASSRQPYAYFGFYAMALAFFHVSEYVVTATFNAHTLSIDSFLINHSWAYGIAAMSSWIEFWLEYYFFPGLKSLHLVSLIGLVMVVGGEVLRKVSMFTAGSNFTHHVQERKRHGHTLVTNGVYALFRHPSYVGWFYWSIGTQVLLCNPICLVAYTLASWRFFDDRILDEELHLIQFFGDDYIQYKRRVGTGIPFIKGFPLEKIATSPFVYVPLKESPFVYVPHKE